MMVRFARSAAAFLVAVLLTAAPRAEAQDGPPGYGPPALNPSHETFFAPMGMGMAGGPPQLGAAPNPYTAAPVNYDSPMMQPGPGYPGAPSPGYEAAPPPMPYGGAEYPQAGGPPSPPHQKGCMCQHCLHGSGHVPAMFNSANGIGHFYGQGIWTKHGPDGTAGCCNPRWFDVHVEFMYLSRDDVSRRVNFTVADAPGDAVVNGPVVLSTDDLDFNEEPGMRVTYNYLTGPGANWEASYFGLFNWASNAAVMGDGNLYSPFNIDFDGLPALIPPAGIGPNVFPEVDAADRHAIEYSTELHSFEFSHRRRFISPHCRFHSSYLWGVRWVNVDEDFIFSAQGESTQTVTDPGTGMPVDVDVDNSAQYRVRTFNDLVGLQVGGDLWLCVIPRFKLGGEIKAGAYNVSADQKTNVRAVNVFDSAVIPPVVRTIEESRAENDIAFVTEAGLAAVFHAHERLTVRGGYQFLFIDGIALAPENVNFDAPFPVMGPRDSVFLNDNGNVFYHGFNAGLEFTW